MNPVKPANILPAVLAAGVIALISFNTSAESPVESRYAPASDTERPSAVYCMPAAYATAGVAADPLGHPGAANPAPSAVEPTGSHGPTEDGVNAELLQPFGIHSWPGRHLTLAPNQAPPARAHEPAAGPGGSESVDAVGDGLRFVF